jgi:mannose-6-phosphate isomerase
MELGTFQIDPKSVVNTKTGILKFEPNRVWRTYQGGKVLDQIEGKETVEDSHFPEDWIGSVTEARNPGREERGEGLSLVKSDSGKVHKFRDMVSASPEFHIEEGASSEDLDRLPLVKYLDSATRLHFQVHPTAAFARERLNANRGKTEAYVILAVREGIDNPYIYAGFQRPPEREQLKQWILDQNIEAIESCFTPIPAKPGDVFLIPGGRPHALGEGILMLEIMEASDLAVRFEFERGGFVIPEEARFMGRDIETSLDVFNFEAVGDDAIDSCFRCEPSVIHDAGSAGRVEELIGVEQTSCFRVQRSIVHGQIRKTLIQGFIGVVAAGKGSVSIDGVEMPLDQWDRFFCPAGVKEIIYDSEGELVVLECYPGSN